MKIYLLISKNITKRNTISSYKRRGRDILHKLKFSDVLKRKKYIRKSTEETEK